ncbi:MAG TPA: DUF1588 domain-containing protein, partial [Polyangiaceae bacterium]
AGHRGVDVKRLLFFALPFVAVAACQAGGASKGEPHAAAAGSGNSGGAPASAGASASPGAPTVSCTTAQLGKPVLRLLNKDQFARTVSDIFPQVAGAWTSTLPADPVSSYGFDNDSGTVVGPQLAQALLDTATAVATAVTGSALAAILPCSSAAADRTCADQFVTQYGRRLFRRTLTQAEHDRYLSFFDTALAKSDFKTALKWLTVGLIQSPNAVYRSEIGSVGGDGSRQLSPTELASELSYTFGGSTPTDALLSQAEGGGALDVVALAKSLLATDAGKATLQHFFESYLDYPRVASIERSGITQFDTLRGDMVQETRAFVDQVVQNHGGLKDLLTAGTSNPSSKLAAYYGFPAPAADYASVARNAGQGIGVLAQGSVLAGRAQPNGSSPTQRGLLVFSRLLCETKPTPPPNVSTISNPDPGKVTTRQRYETLHAPNPVCNSCHKLFDPIGFGFEHFDEGGRFRADDGGLPINTVSHVPNPDGSSLFEFQDQETLARGLADQPVVYQCFAAYLATFAFGSGESCLGASHVADLKAGTLGIADFYAALASEPHFTRRAAQ